MRIRPAALAVAALATTAATTASSALLAPAAHAGGPPVTIEADYDATLTSHPVGHHTANNFRDAETGYPGDWSADYGLAAGTPVRPRLSGPDGLTLTVAKVAPACTNGGGGQGVQVSVGDASGEIGRVAYLHLEDVTVAEGDTVSTDTVLGVVGGDIAYDSSCWTGPHLHLEGFNRSDYSCFIAPETAAPGTPLGRIGGSDVQQRETACP
ncbi:M23 family metallopeptidase [Nocardioides zeae]|uniref:M23 family metallopeptidase n=1 Tax=Nocardioides imazamoxiresistens TaxID=3231893 RepID=A0ABU3PWJ5_9ACTN|nr:M23 family metallopeptidase [Nocardioides zeae]MDT9593606.1 M23 family metallopeptidase [Nocardioides zeae]